MFEPQGGRWPAHRLHVAVGLALTLVAAALAAAPAPVLGATTFVVNRTGDAADRNPADGKCDTSTASGKQCTLRAAIQQANATAGADTINFKITSASKVIAPATPLPAITEQLFINGYSQTGAKANTKAIGNNAVLKIVLDGVHLPAGSVGLDVRALKSTIKGLDIQRFAGTGLVLASHQIAVLGNFIGTNVAGTAARGNGDGIDIHDQANTIGGSEPAERNVISGNVHDGIALHAPDVNIGNVISGNYIGTDKTGAVDLGNGDSGVLIDDGAKTTIGGSTVGAGNVISGNDFVGVNAQGTNAAFTVISGNYIGTDAAGTRAISNSNGGVRLALSNMTVGGDTPNERNVISGTGDGILIDQDFNVVQGNYIGVDASGATALGNAGIGILINANSNTIGGATAALRNVISANGGDGVRITAGISNVVIGNRIGTRADGTGDLGNGHAGVFIFGGNKNTIGGSGASGNVISGNGRGVETGINLTGAGTLIQGNAITANDEAGITAAAGSLTILGNSIVANGGSGILVRAGTQAATITGNRIHGNAGLGIDLSATFAADGVTPNDTDDPDAGGNALQNFPVLSGAVFSILTNSTTVTGSLNSTASTQFRIELFVAVPDPSGHGEAQDLVAVQNITTNAGGDRGFSFHIAGLPGLQLTATATAIAAGGAGRTSEFSANRIVAIGP